MSALMANRIKVITASEGLIEHSGTIQSGRHQVVSLREQSSSILWFCWNWWVTKNTLPVWLHCCSASLTLSRCVFQRSVSYSIRVFIFWMMGWWPVWKSVFNLTSFVVSFFLPCSNLQFRHDWSLSLTAVGRVLFFHFCVFSFCWTLPPTSAAVDLWCPVLRAQFAGFDNTMSGAILGTSFTAPASCRLLCRCEKVVAQDVWRGLLSARRMSVNPGWKQDALR